MEYWAKLDLPYDRIVVPDPNIQALLDACIRNIYQAREIKEDRPAFQVGPTCYRGTWAADGPFILEAVTYLGRAAETRAGLEQQVDQDQGPGGVAFSKKCSCYSDGTFCARHSLDVGSSTYDDHRKKNGIWE